MGITTELLHVFFCLIHKRKSKERSSILHASYPKDLPKTRYRNSVRHYWWSCPCLATGLYIRQLL